MSAIIEPVSKQDHEIIIKALYGSYEKMTQSDIYLSCKDRHDYLVKLLDNIQRTLERSKSKIKYWDFINKFLYTITVKAINKTLIPKISEMIKDYRLLMIAPFEFPVKMYECRFNKFIKDNYEFIETINTEFGITEDKYLNSVVKIK